MAISVVINTYNAEQHLAEVLETVKNFDEIVVCDMESTDSTVKIANEYGCKVVTFPKGNYTIVEPARNFAIQSASNEWVLLVDADELVTPQLHDFVYDAISNPNCPDAFFVPRKNHVFGKYLKSTYPDYHFRFFRKEGVDWPPYIHSVPTIDGVVEHIPKEREDCALIHLSSTARSSFIKMNDYSDNDLIKRGAKSVSILNLIFEPSFRFFKNYILKGGIFYGRLGFIQACNNAIGRYMLVVKQMERNNEIKSGLKKQDKSNCFDPK